MKHQEQDNNPDRVETILNDPTLRTKLRLAIRQPITKFTDSLQLNVPNVPSLCFRDDSGKEFVFTDQPTITVGRIDTKHDIIPRFDLSSHDGLEHGVSRKHARISYIKDRFYLTDLESANGTYVNGRSLLPGQATPIYENDVIILGRYKLTVEWIT